MPSKRTKSTSSSTGAEETPAVVADYSSLTVAALRDQCKAKGIDATGAKAALVARLQGADGAGATKADAAPAVADEEQSSKRTKRGGKAAAAAAVAPEEEPAPKHGGGRKPKRAAEEEAAEETKEEAKAEEPAPAAKRGRKGKKDEAAEAPAPAAAAAPEPSEPKGKKGKKGKAEPEAAAAEEPSSKSEKMASLKAKGSSKLRKTATVDSHVPGAGSFSVYSNAVETFDVMLNQTNIGHNNNKYYVIQVLQRGGQFYTWNRWGRVGEPGQNKLSGPMGEAAAVSEFKKKFKDKTSNNWDQRDNFQKVKDKYDMVDMDDSGEAEEAPVVAAGPAGPPVKVKPCTLPDPTAKLVKLLFDHDMFREAMANLEIDVQKMPLGKISKAQIAKGYEVLEEMKDLIIAQKRLGDLSDLSSTFYTIIPHSFGRQVPPVIRTMEMLQAKMDMLEVLGDIEIALGLEKKEEEKGATEVPHPIDQNFSSLHCGLELVDRESKEFKAITAYLNATMEGRGLKLDEVWKVDREGEAARFKAHDDIKERKLLWHGTNVAVVAAILKTGLRIMPHSGGRVGRGIYFASENSKSAGYGSTNTGIMFLAEVALGKEHHITMDDYRLSSAPKGYDSIVAKGSGEPDPTKDTTIVLDGHPVVVPQGKRIPQPQFSGSNFDKSEYLIYKESQHRIRYLLKLKF